jgi:hypothetical protein
VNDRRRSLLAALALVLAAAPGGAAERTRLVKARVFIFGGGREVHHELSVASKDTARNVVSVLVGQFPGLVKEPRAVSAPDGWRSQVLQRDGRDGLLWSVRFTCIDPDPAQATPSVVVPNSGCGLRAGQSVKFALVLPYQSASLETEPVFVDFSDGRTAVASR